MTDPTTARDRERDRDALPVAVNPLTATLFGVVVGALPYVFGVPGAVASVALITTFGAWLLRDVEMEQL